jgi:small subunit ribosomal protein S4
VSKKKSIKLTKLCRQYGVDIWGDGRYTRNFKPGQHGKEKRVSFPSDYGRQLSAYKLIAVYYGAISKKQMRSLYLKADSAKGNTAESLAGLLERRLATVVYRLNFAPSIFAARQLISHKKIKVNGRVINISSYLVTPGDVIEVVDGDYRQNIHLTSSLAAMKNGVPEYIELDAKNFKGTFLNIPALADIPYPFEVEMSLMIEFFSR